MDTIYLVKVKERNDPKWYFGPLRHQPRHYGTMDEAREVARAVRFLTDVESAHPVKVNVVVSRANASV